MLPFPRMIQYNNVVDHKILLDIDFSRQTIGDRTVTDFTGNSSFSLVSGGTAGTVQYDSTIGTNVMKLTGGRYRTPMSSILNLTTRDFQIETTFLTNTTSSVLVLWESGDWSGSRIPGISNSLNSYASTYIQYFIDNGSAFNRVLINGTNTLQWETVVFTYRRGVGISTYRKLTNTTQTFPVYTFGAGTELSLFGSYTGGSPYYFTGSVQKIKITEL